MAQTRPSPTLSRGFTRPGRFLAPYGVSSIKVPNLVSHNGNPTSKAPDQEISGRWGRRCPMRAFFRMSAVCLVLVLLASSLGRLGAQSTDPLIGTWTLNVERSSYSLGTLPQSATRTFEDWGDGLIFVRNDGINATGDSTGSRIVFRRDGRDYPISTLGSQVYLTIRFNVVSMNPFNVEYRPGVDGDLGGNVGVETISADGRTYTVRITLTNQQGQAVNNVQIWEKQ